ncbi:hypothetical protein P8V03_15080 [Clostridium sp. A1-XYC3]|uniref:Uncharacterized protein n=1 Tax=Clostridium tanneri TaxID=3037988 RepID=A0ABU4JWJ5_9CLOT|nr:hypothetical protein [Clostridium sp. A1-XYC3]MDW8802471.1 hypothetical protein [Clostridium sp. A1-XYC3]
MTIKEEMEKLFELEEISDYLNKEEKKYIIRLFKEYEKIFQKAYEFENNKDRIAVIIFYNLLITDEEIKNRKMKDSSKLMFSLKNLSKITQLPEKSLYVINNKFQQRFSNLIKDIISKNTGKMDESFSKLVENLLKNIKKHRRKIDNQQISNKVMMNIFLTTFENVKSLYSDKNAIKIKEYLIHMQANMILAGYNVDEEKLEEIFSQFSKHLGFELSDGRNEEDFVAVKDIYGKCDNKVYIEFRR